MKTQPVHVMHVVHRLTTGGAERVLVNLVNGSSPAFFHHVVSFCPPDEFAETIQSKHCRVWSLDKHEGNDFSLSFKIRRIVQQNNIAVIHAQGWGVYAESLFAACFLGRKVPYVFAFRGKTFEDTKGIPWRRRIAQRFFAHWCDAIITPSDLMRTEYAQDMGISKERIQVLYNGVNEEQFSSCKPVSCGGCTTIGCVARLDTVKGVDLLVGAVGALVGEGYDLRLRVVGDGEERSRLEDQVSRLGLIDRVELPGWSRTVEMELQKFDMYVQPSRYEGVSNAILEAMAAGKAIVATDVGGTPEVIENEVDGLLVEPTTEGIAAGIRRLLNDAVFSAGLGVTARQRVINDFSLKKMVQNYEDLFLSVRGR